MINGSANNELATGTLLTGDSRRFSRLAIFAFHNRNIYSVCAFSVHCRGLALSETPVQILCRDGAVEPGSEGRNAVVAKKIERCYRRR